MNELGSEMELVHARHATELVYLNFRIFFSMKKTVLQLDFGFTFRLKIQPFYLSLGSMDDNFMDCSSTSFL